MRNLCCVVLLRGIAAGKSRLSPVLSPADRMALNSDLLRHTLGVAEAFLGDPARCLLVTPCADARKLAAAAGVDCVDEPIGADINGAAACGVAAAWNRGASGVLLLPCDLPALTSAALHELRDALFAGDMAIAPDGSHAGTNALGLRPNRMPRFTFGPGSFHRHRTEARANGWRVVTCDSPELAFDLDTPADLARWRETQPGPATGQVEYAPLI